MISQQANVHETAVVDTGAIIGARTKVWHFSHIMRGAIIGRDCVLGQNVHVAPDVVIGDRCKIQNNVSIYTGVRLEDSVFIGPSVVFTNILTPRAHINRKNAYQSTLIAHGASIGANATVLCGITVGRYALIGAGTVVTHDVPPYTLFFGNPGNENGYVCHCGNRLYNETQTPNQFRCRSCKAEFENNTGTITPKERRKR